MSTANNFEEFRESLWGVADGRRIPIKDLKLDHLVNILNWVKDRPAQYKPSLHPMLEQEANFRKLSLFAAGKPMPVRGNDGRWYLVDGKTGKQLETKAKSNYAKVDTRKR